MAATILDGRSLALQLRERLKQEIADFVNRHGFRPKLVTVLVGDDPASIVYVNIKRKVAEELGFAAEVHHLPANSPEGEVVALIERLNLDPNVSGILVQHPTPPHINEDRVMATISPWKDVDGLTPFSLGALAARSPNFVPCTPLGALKLLQHYGISLEGKEAVVVGCSRINGLPAALLFLQHNATVTICHIYTRDLASHTRRADILYVAAGNPEFITADMVKPGVVVIDTGSNRVPNRKGDVGDVHFESVKEVASYITPVPGGIGPMTVTMLMFNTLEAARRQVQKETISLRTKQL
ncbi:MAG: bifunctional 5,10-methylenetetrahydrofolate dehydrogenase/5,10-methenyltetrahydrofolate cyclohydrolase [Armatimonadota bacterium]|nr:bifunctional 5,10-methylenetetrahydrofolate dehydrogenase/5,10-methenyltetrahydrofolate cyclohydrolase [Armatimonadota bacterium]MDW8141978.1 bifunctional 5,10-methylenetetrahydrofolate dehydrogenase/5,10-methenyltetrahydrofolate cyclohydrolase [Armatimonadota bacterium]